MKRYVIFAGVNGAGKTTLYQTNDEYIKMPRINMDEIVREFGTWKNKKDAYTAGKIAVEKVREYFDKGISFNQETTLCGHGIIRNINTAIKLNYEIELNYVGVSSSKVAIDRVDRRVKMGGHGIPREDIERRYKESLKNLKKIIPICNYVIIYDNSELFRKVATYVNGECVDIIEDVPEWCRDIISHIYNT